MDFLSIQFFENSSITIIKGWGIQKIMRIFAHEFLSSNPNPGQFHFNACTYYVCICIKYMYMHNKCILECMCCTLLV